jgi:hypothetical protein
MLPNSIINTILDFIKKPCDDCGRFNIKLKCVHACDDWKGCCYKKVCYDYCVYYCENNHANINECLTYFCLPPFDIDDEYSFDDELREYSNHSLSCNICNSEVYIRRKFRWESYPR